MSKESFWKENPFATAGVVLPIVVAAGKVVVDKLTGAQVNLSEICRDLAAVAFLTIPLGLGVDIARETIEAVKSRKKKH